MEKRTHAIKKMAELLKSGATMLAETCPVKDCNLPLFKLKSGEIVCPIHGKIYLVKTEEEARKIEEELTIRTILDKLERNILRIINERIDLGEFTAHDLINYLEIIERIYRIKSLISKSSSK